MFSIIKKAGKRVPAYELGTRNEALDRLMAEGKILPLGDGRYRVMSEEAFRGGSGEGEVVRAGDFVKMTDSGFPYPNQRDFFLKNHRRVEGDEYVQIPLPLSAWELGQPMGEEMEFLVRHKGLAIDPDDPEGCFSALLWGTREAAPRDAVIVFYSITRDPGGRITDIDFNFIVREEFEKFYDRCD